VEELSGVGGGVGGLAGEGGFCEEEDVSPLLFVRGGVESSKMTIGGCVIAKVTVRSKVLEVK
jgi:hypothetical protein